MKKTLSNVVLCCDSNEEAKKVTAILNNRGHKHVDIYEEYIEIYEEKTPQQWAELIKDIEADLRERTIAEKLDAAQVTEKRADDLQAEVDRLRAEVDRLRAEVEKQEK